MDGVGLAIAEMLPPEYRGAYGESLKACWPVEAGRYASCAFTHSSSRQT